MNNSKVNAAKELLLKAVRVYSKPVVILFSGGRDSLIVLDLAYHTLGPRRFIVVYVKINGNTHPESYRIAVKTLRSYDVNFHILTSPYFWSLFRRYGYPFLPMKYNPKWRGLRWCLRECKQKVWDQYVCNRIVIDGIKANDRLMRKQMIERHGPIHEVNTAGYSPHISVRILHDWTDRDVAEYIESYGLKEYLDPCYTLIGRSGNCTFCFFLSKRKVLDLLKDDFGRKCIEKWIEIHEFLRKHPSMITTRKTFQYFNKIYNHIKEQRLITGYL